MYYIAVQTSGEILILLECLFFVDFFANSVTGKLVTSVII